MVADVRVAGAAVTEFAKSPQATIRGLGERVAGEALADAGLGTDDVDIVFFSNATAGLLTGQEMIRGQVALRHTGLLGLPIVNVENACASASTAFYLAVNAVSSGAAEVALAVGAEKLSHEDKTRSFEAIGSAVDLFEIDELIRWASEARVGAAPAGDHSLFMDIYAANARAYMERSGATAEDFAEVAVKSHDHAALNPKAQYRTPISVEEVLASRVISSPLTLLMCSPIADGAAAVVVCSDERARSLPGRSVQVRSCVLVSGTDEPGDGTAAEIASAGAYEQAGIGPDELDLVELHDAAAPAELTTYEEIGLCPPGDGPKLLRSGATRLGGSVVVNPSGGLLSKGHPIGATGCAQLVELVDQLRGRCGPRQVPDARIALAENGGGFLKSDAAAMVVTILSL